MYNLVSSLLETWPPSPYQWRKPFSSSHRWHLIGKVTQSTCCMSTPANSWLCLNSKPVDWNCIWHVSVVGPPVSPTWNFLLKWKLFSACWKWIKISQRHRCGAACQNSKCPRIFKVQHFLTYSNGTDQSCMVLVECIKGHVLNLWYLVGFEICLHCQL